MKKRMLSMFLVVVMVFTIVDITAYAQEQSGMIVEEIATENGDIQNEESAEDGTTAPEEELEATEGTTIEPTKEPTVWEKEGPSVEPAAEVLITSEEIDDNPSVMIEEIEELVVDTDDGILDHGMCGDDLFWNLTYDGVLTISGTGDMDDFERQSDVPWNGNKEYLQKLVIEEGLTSIGDNAFGGYKNLSEVVLPDTLIKIGTKAFSGCSSLTEVVLPSALIKLEDYAFWGCSSLSEVAIPDSVTSIGFSVFEESGIIITYNPNNIGAFDCVKNNAVKIVVMEGVSEIQDSALENLKLLKEVVLPSSLITIGDYAFRGCSSLSEVNIPEGVTTIGISSFYGCSSLSKVVLPSSLSQIGGYAFYECSSLCKVVIPKGITTIEPGTFDGCNKLDEVVIPDSVTTIGDSAFWGCSSLSEVNIPDSVTTIEEAAFYECGSLSKVVIPEGVTIIDSLVFAECVSLRDVMLPSKLIAIRGDAFLRCRSLSEVVLPNTLTAIGDSAFWGCSSLSEVNIPDSVKTIGEYAFYYCDSLKSVSIGKGIKVIEKETFSYCSELVSIVIPYYVENINSGAFEGCNSLISVTLPRGLKSIADDAFSNINILTIYGCVGTYAETYANSKNIKFENIYDEEYGEVLEEDIPYNGIIPSGMWIAGVAAEYTYSGKEIKPVFRVYDYNTLLKDKVDYTVSYANNIKPNNASISSTAPTIKVTGKGNYQGTETETFRIMKKDISDRDITVTNSVVVYNKKVQKKIPTVKRGNTNLKKDTDFTVSYPDLEDNPKAYKAPGTYTILVKGKGGYTGTREVKLTITESKLMSKVTVSQIATQPYTGAAITTATMNKVPTVKYGDKTKLKEGVHYTVTYQNNVKIGTATMILTGTDKETPEGTFTGTKKVTFKIGGTSLAKAKVTGVPTSMTYTGLEITERTEKWGNPIKVVLNGDELTRAADVG